MITMSNFGAHGRLANQLFQYASMIGIANRLNTGHVLPEWKYAEYFDCIFPEQEHSLPAQIKQVHEYSFTYDDFFEDYSDIHAYLQSEKYWSNAKKEVLKALKFKQSFKDKVRKGYDFSKPVIAIHIRLGDYVNHECYYQLPITYFYNAINQWKDWRKCNVILFSDDIPYCKLHFDCLENVQFATGNEIEDMCLASQCQRFVLSNSSYSWWMAYLSGSKQVIRPDCLFRGTYKETHDDKDFWIKSWKVLKPEQRINLKDVTFTIPVYWDHPDRQHNLNLSVCLIQHYCDTNIIICENKGSQFQYMAQWCEYYQSEHESFHRTRMLNDMAREANTPIIFNWDADIVISPIQIISTVEKLRSGIDMVFPYDGRFARINRHDWFKKLESSLDVGILAGIEFSGMEETAVVSMGGAIGYRKKEYLDIGGENENFISFGAEDVERVVRAEKLGLKVERVKGCLYHINHWTGVNSTTRNPYFMANREEFERVKEMSKEDLIEYIKTWENNLNLDK